MLGKDLKNLLITYRKYLKSDFDFHSFLSMDERLLEAINTNGEYSEDLLDIAEMDLPVDVKLYAIDAFKKCASENKDYYRAIFIKNNLEKIFKNRGTHINDIIDEIVNYEGTLEDLIEEMNKRFYVVSIPQKIDGVIVKTYGDIKPRAEQGLGIIEHDYELYNDNEKEYESLKTSLSFDETKNNGAKDIFLELEEKIDNFKNDGNKFRTLNLLRLLEEKMTKSQKPQDMKMLIILSSHINDLDFKNLKNNTKPYYYNKLISSIYGLLENMINKSDYIGLESTFRMIQICTGYYDFKDVYKKSELSFVPYTLAYIDLFDYLSEAEEKDKDFSRKLFLIDQIIRKTHLYIHQYWGTDFIKRLASLKVSELNKVLDFASRHPVDPYYVRNNIMVYCDPKIIRRYAYLERTLQDEDVQNMDKLFSRYDSYYRSFSSSDRIIYHSYDEDLFKRALKSEIKDDVDVPVAYLRYKPTKSRNSRFLIGY